MPTTEHKAARPGIMTTEAHTFWHCMGKTFFPSGDVAVTGSFFSLTAPTGF